MKEDAYFHSSSCGNLNDKLMPLHWDSYEVKGWGRVVVKGKVVLQAAVAYHGGGGGGGVQKKLLSVYATELFEKEHSGCHALFRDDKVDDLSRMYRLFSKIPHGLDSHVAAEGTALVEQAEDVASNKKAENRDMVGLQEQALKEAFEIFRNKGVSGSYSAELLATFCDNILKKGGSEKLSNEAIKDTLEKVVKLLAYISDKDLFAEFYRKKLARRLLFDKSANDEHERSILTKLKHYKSFDLNLPIELVKCVEVFKEFYEAKTKHTKLTWVYSLGTCNINGKFDQKTVELIVTTYQASTLLLFNLSDRLTYQEIKTQLNLSDDDVIRLLQSLSCAKYNILIKEPNTKTISPNDYFEFNSKFTDKMRRIKIPLPPIDEKKKVIEDVDKDRRYAIDASIVRIMKSRKVLGYQQLVMECVEQLGRMFKIVTCGILLIIMAVGNFANIVQTLVLKSRARRNAS
ncbi:hypothetical protein L2E82_42477 [Cichorium intybus]|uniref:Uncharacterized protein n=1 Tax=Cichorium intybus TaxID=13427 RepID=A0ACB8ZN92_CICIN|nr:hypothetical protein L2E82_42477 [Cichorium intybus]